MKGLVFLLNDKICLSMIKDEMIIPYHGLYKQTYESVGDFYRI